MGTQTKTLAEQVADGIMNLIQETPYKAGDKLPTEKELCESTGAGRNTVREALKILASRNVLEIRQGARTGSADAGSTTPASTVPAPIWQCLPTIARPPRIEIGRASCRERV